MQHTGKLRLGAPSTSRIAVRVTSDAERQIRAGHPWIFDKSIVSLSRDGQAGDLAVVFDKKRKFLAIGLLDPGSPIRLKILHRGRPQSIDRDFWSARIATACELRSSIADDPATNAYRLVNGENDGLPGLVVDRYDQNLVIKLYSAAWFPHLPLVMAVLNQLLKPEAVVLRLSRNVAKGNTFGCSDGMTVALDGSSSEGSSPMLVQGEPLSGPVRFKENGLDLSADLESGQKTGHFLDQRENRARVRELSAGLRVLDVFSCTGGFALNAAAGGALSVHATDLSRGAIQNVQANFALNQHNSNVAKSKLSTSVGDAFERLEEMSQRNEKFDLVVIDPPSFAQKQSDIESGLRAYRRLTELGLSVTASNGILMQASCSSRIGADQFFDGVYDSARRSGYRLHEIDRALHPVDHPATFQQGHYLKAIFVKPEAFGSAGSTR